MSEQIAVPKESGVETSMLNWLEDIGWEIYGDEKEEGGKTLDRKFNRENHREVIYWDLLKEQLIKINQEIDESNVDEFISSLKRDLNHQNLMSDNQKFYQLLRRGKKFSIEKKDGSTEAKYIQLIDFNSNLEKNKNRLIAVNQFRVRGNDSIRPDLTLFINGIPIVVGELKSITQDNDYFDAIEDLQKYEEKAPKLFIPCLFNIAADTLEYRYGAVGAPKKFYLPWNESPVEFSSDNRMKQAVQSMLNPGTLLDLIDNFVFYEKSNKIIPRYMQYYATNRILERLDKGKHNKGLIWHTQGSGKSYTMFFTAHNLLNRNILDNPQILIVVDEDKLRGQMSNDLSNIGFANYEVAGSITQLQQMLESGTSKLILTSIQMFNNVDSNVQSNKETVVLVDEAHRFMEKKLGTKLEAALPEAYNFGFTGTPVREKARDTFANFCPEDELYLHRYSIKKGIEDKLILPVYFTLRHEMDWEINEEVIDEEFEKIFNEAFGENLKKNFNQLSVEQKAEFIKENLTQQQLTKLTPRIKKIAEEVTNHFEGVNKNGWKGMVITPLSKKAAKAYGQQLRKYFDPEEVRVIISGENNNDNEEFPLVVPESKQDGIIKDFKKKENPKLLIVCQMLLTGFDASVLKTIYLDQNLKNHRLLQAIARTNRLADGKNNGEIVDFTGAFKNLDDALDYGEQVKTYAARDKEEMLDEFEELLNKIMAIFEEFPKDNSQEIVAKCIAKVNKNPYKRQFKQGYRKLESLYESISPDKRLITRKLLEKYEWLSYIYIAFRRNNNREENPEENLQEKTRRILEDNVSITNIKKDFPVYKLSEEHLEKIENFEPAAKATEIAHATQEHLRINIDKNPRYEKLSERLREVINSWQSNNLSDLEAVEVLEKIELEVIEIDKAPEKEKMNDAEYAIYISLIEVYNDQIEDEEEARKLARSIIESFEENIDRFDNWKVKAEDKIRRMLIRVLVKNNKKSIYYNSKEFITDATEYLLENYG